MGKKALVPDSSGSILLTLPEGTAYQSAVGAFLESQGFRSQPFFFNPAGETVTIDMVRELLQHSSYARAQTEPQTLVVCAAHTATLPAQNALLKIVEEPPPHTQIILAVYPGRQILPTLISRCREILWTEAAESIQADPLEQERAALEKFLSQPESFSHHEVIKLAETFKEGKITQQILRSVIRDRMADPKSKISRRIMQHLLAALESLEQNGNVRIVLEHFFFRIKEHTAN